MEAVRATSRMLDDEHRAHLALLGELERSIAALPRGAQPDAALVANARAIARLCTDELERHFRFEEEALFPRLAAAGEGDIAALLVEEHAAIRATAADALPLLLAAAGGSLAPAGLAELKPLALELAERLVAHIQKETMALLPMLELLLDDEADRELAFAYATP